MAIFTFIDLVEYEKTLERQQTLLNVFDAFSLEDISDANKCFNDLRAICRKRIAVMNEVNEADQS